MPAKPILTSLLTSLLLLAGAAGTAIAADDPCAGFKWDIARERALFAGAGAQLSAGKDPASAPAIVAGRLYALKLLPQTAVVFAVQPGQKKPLDGQYAGLAALTLADAGDYRVSVDAPAWLDVAMNGTLAAVEDFQGQHGCEAPRKVVQFDLAHTQKLVLQVSGNAKDTIRLTVTKAPPKT
jgi:hypothetical protein